MGHLKRARVRHRGPNQCRRTFASQALSCYVPVEWVARQLGHTDTTMVKKHYGRWIPSDTRSMAGIVSQMMGFRPESS
ncbi:integrase [Pseudomonas sp. BN102]|nr:integrase [Pseudomonas sp. BN102]